VKTITGAQWRVHHKYLPFGIDKFEFSGINNKLKICFYMIAYTEDLGLGFVLNISEPPDLQGKTLIWQGSHLPFKCISFRFQPLCIAKIIRTSLYVQATSAGFT
jgi:hypothetical protein